MDKSVTTFLTETSVFPKKRCNDAAEKMSQSVSFFSALWIDIVVYIFASSTVPLHAVAARIARAARYTATASFPPIFFIFPHLRFRGRNEKYRQKREKEGKERIVDFLCSFDPAWAEPPHVTGEISGKNRKKGVFAPGACRS